MEKELNVLVVSPHVAHRNYLQQSFKGLPVNTLVVTTNQQAREMVLSLSFDLVFCEENTTDGSYEELLKLALAKNTPRFVVILIEGIGNGYLEAIRLGVTDVLGCPLQLSDIDAVLRSALRASSAVTARAEPHREFFVEPIRVSRNCSEAENWPKLGSQG